MANDNSNRTRVFVYGTLKSGHGNHSHYLKDNDGAKYLGRCYVSGDYRMYSNGAFPIVTTGDDRNRVAHIVGEVYEVDEETLLALDCLEGHPSWYKRIKVDTPFKKAWMYTMPYSDRWERATFIESGCFAMTTEEAEFIHGSEIQAAL